MEELIQPVEQTLIFSMVISIGNELVPCHVFYARAQDNTTFTRVITYPGITKAERIIDVDFRDGEWIDIYRDETSPWSLLVGPSLNYDVAQNNKA